MNKAIIAGIIAAIIIIIGVVGISMPLQNDGNESQSELPGIDSGENTEEPQGRNLTVELDESLGLSSP